MLTLPQVDREPRAGAALLQEIISGRDTNKEKTEGRMWNRGRER